MDATLHNNLVQGDRVHRRIYTDPEIFDAEMRRIFATTWVFIGHESEVPTPGDFKTDTIARRPIILVRGDDGKVRVLYNVCRHRGAKLCHEAYGHGRFRCLYHGWVYDSQGKLSGVPRREQFRDFDNDADYGLIAVPRVESYRGFVFASLSPHGQTLQQYLGRGMQYLDEMCDRAPDGEIEAVRPIKYDFRGNWKLQMENYSDNYHPAVLHQSALDIGIKMMKEKYGNRSLTEMAKAPGQYRERGYGAGHGMADFAGSRGGVWMNAYANPKYKEALAQKYGEARAGELVELDTHMMIYPNLLLHTRMNHYRVIKPLAVDHTEVWTYPCKLKGAPDDVNEINILNTSHHCSAMGEVQVDDIQCFAWVQEGLKVEEMEWVVFKLYGEDERFDENGEMECRGTSEGIIRYQYKEWARLMGQG
jgi:phenylpropionate dioxygenase-like ring-hydroxylating dioxygenase large terminal subunit